MLRTLITGVALVACSAALAEETVVTDEMRAMFAEVIQATAAPRAAVELAMEQNSPDCRAGATLALTDLNSGSCGIPDAITTPNGVVASVSVNNGLIFATGTAEVSGATYTLAPDSVTPPVRWVEGGTCTFMGLC